MEVWFRYEEFKNSHPFWEIPKIPAFFNGKIWKVDTPYWNTKKGKTIKKSKGRYPGDQPNNGIQGQQYYQQNPGHYSGQYNQQPYNQYPPPPMSQHPQYPQYSQQPGGQSMGQYPQQSGGQYPYQNPMNQYPGGQSVNYMQGQQYHSQRPREYHGDDNHSNNHQYRSRDRSNSRHSGSRTRTPSRQRSSNSDPRYYKDEETRDPPRGGDMNENNDPGYGGYH